MIEGIISILDSKYNNAYLELETNNTKYIINGYENIGKVFHGDLVQINNDKCIIKQSNIENKSIIGVIQLYSKYKFKSNKKGIERYKFIPIEKHYPEFLVCTKVKRKYKKNILVNIKFLSWDDKLPYGQIINILGEIDDINALYQGVLHKYQLLQKQIKIDKNIINIIKNIDNYNDITNHNIISIDPLQTIDIDDAISFYKLSDNNFKIGIHISDVIGTLKDINLDYILNNKLSTSIYPPHCNIHMLPSILSENILSLLPNKKRKAITLWLIINNNKIISSKIEKTIIVNKHKYSYDEFTNRHFNNINSKYQIFIQLVKNLKYKNLYNKFKNSFDSHKLIEKLMIIYNCEACLFIKNNEESPIYRIHTNHIEPEILNNIDYELKDFLNIIHTNSAEYSFNNNNNYHYSLDITDYIHFTSPIRRYVDCYNHSLIHKILSNSPTIDIDISYINKINKLVKKSERIFSRLLLAEYIKKTNNNKFKGYIYQLEKNKAFIYIPDYKITIYKYLVDKKLDKLYNIQIENNIIKIINNQTNFIKQFSMYVLLDLEIYIIIDKNPYNNIIVNIIDTQI
jgi:ribonuclease R